MSNFQGNNYEIYSSAWTGTACTFLLKERTIHSLLKLLYPVTETSICNISSINEQANYLINMDLIILDEVSMTPSFALQAIEMSERYNWH